MPVKDRVDLKYERRLYTQERRCEKLKKENMRLRKWLHEIWLKVNAKKMRADGRTFMLWLEQRTAEENDAEEKRSEQT